jgi:hypothetical protein
MCVAVMPALVLKSSPARCCVLPLPDDEKFSLPGCCFAYSTSSFTEFTGSLLLTISRLGASAKIATGAKSLTGS